jgi:hypothetical protein
MRVAVAAALFFLGCALVAAQTAAPAGEQTAAPAEATTPAQAATPGQTSTPAPAATTSQAAAPAPNAPAATQSVQVDDSDVGFTYSLPADWEFVAPATAPKITVPFPDAVAAKRGDACVEVVFTAKHGSPASVVVVVALPFACYGQSMNPGDLANFGAGAAEGMKQTFDITDPVEGNYTLGSHAVWIERAKGTPKGHPEKPFTFEIACTVLNKGTVCWMTMATDWPSLRDFQRSPVALDGDAFDALVPPHSFVHDDQ